MGRIDRRKTGRIVAIAVAVYVVLLAGSYLLLWSAHTKFDRDYVYWNMATSISAEVDDHYDTSTPRPQASGSEWSKPRTHSPAVWTVLGTWWRTREKDDAMAKEALSHLEWVYGTIDE